MITGIVLLVLVVVVAVFAIVVARQPDDFRITRTLAISAPAAVAFAQVNDLHRWQAFAVGGD